MTTDQFEDDVDYRIEPSVRRKTVIVPSRTDLKGRRPLRSIPYILLVFAILVSLVAVLLQAGRIQSLEETVRTRNETLNATIMAQEAENVSLRSTVEALQTLCPPD